MQTSLEVEWDDFDRWISWALTADSRDARPTEEVWQRIVHRVANLDWATRSTPARGRSSRPCPSRIPASRGG